MVAATPTRSLRRCGMARIPQRCDGVEQHGGQQEEEARLVDEMDWPGPTVDAPRAAGAVRGKQQEWPSEEFGPQDEGNRRERRGIAQRLLPQKHKPAAGQENEDARRHEGEEE